MPIKFVWDSSYTVENQIIDSQHRRLFDLGNDIQNVQPSALRRVIMDLYKHTRQHFDTEEQHMKSIGYPKLEHHRELHNGLISGLNDLTGTPIDTAAALESFKKFVYNWIIDHILHHDKEYFEYYREHVRPTATGAGCRRGRPRKGSKAVTHEA